jgi:hypothetical protein
MKDVSEYEKDLASIRSMMDRSAKFISLSGLSGIFAGIYALGGATAAYFLLEYPGTFYRSKTINEPATIIELLIIASIVLGSSITTGLWLTQRKTLKQNTKLWTPASKLLLQKVAIPLVTGGLFILIMLFTGHFELAAPSCLIFYGLALIHGASNTFDEIRYLGFSEIILGLVCALFSGYGLLFWAIGFGVLHIVYGAVLYNKYDS